MRFSLFLALALGVSSVSAHAQNEDLGEPVGEGGAVENIAVEGDDGPLRTTVTDDSDWDDLGIAIPAFATDRDQPTPANADGTASLGREIARVITANLQNNGLFKPSGPDSLPRPSYGQIRSPVYPTWDSRGAEMLVHGYVQSLSDGRLEVGCYLYDVLLEDQLIREGYRVRPADWRRAAHKCSDLIYARLTGEDPFFDSRIAYIAETGPKDNRVKRLAVMDSDGANHRFLTLGSATALTPRYSPDYSKLLYLSYVDGNPRIYVYDIDRGSQSLVAETGNPTLAPRWSPDGEHILYSMAVAGNTDIYRVPVSGGRSVRLTNTPG
ncbi:MAG: Tol-Pal system protein TolB, partial [Pseudomonadota bacterium]